MTALRSVSEISMPAPASTAWRWAGHVLFAVTLVALFIAYLRLSATYPENSDEANILLMASDLAHGNLLLTGWRVSDVPFITTELPEIAVAVKLFGLHLETAHVAAALTYTIVVAVAMLLAKGRTRGPQAVVRMAIALAIMLAPQPGVGVFVMIFSVGHIGTAAPVMLAWLVLDRYPRWIAPVAVGGLLAWALLADPLVLVIGILPVLVVMTVRLTPDLIKGIRNGGWRCGIGRTAADRWLEAAMIAAAGAAYLAAWAGGRLVRAAGGYTQQPVPYTLDPVSAWYAHCRIAVHGLLEMFGAFFLPGNAINYLGPGNYVAAPSLSGLAEVVAVTRLACLGLVIWAACAVARRFFRRDADLVSQLLLVGLVANLAAYLPSSLADHTALNAREFAPVLPFAAAGAARVFTSRLSDSDRIGFLLAGRSPVDLPGRAKVALPVALCALLCWYGFGLFSEARLPAAPDPFARLETFLIRHHLTNGIGGYWNSSVITVDTGGAITVRAVTQGCLQPYGWEARPAWYDPVRNTASFLLEETGPGFFRQWQASPAALQRLGILVPAAGPAPLRPGGGYTVHTYHGNLLAQLPLVARCLPVIGKEYATFAAFVRQVAYRGGCGS